MSLKPAVTIALARAEEIVAADAQKSRSPRPIKTYSHHNCSRVHRTHRALAECMFRRQRPWWVSGQGEYATLSYCRGLTVALWRTLAEAQDALSLIDGDACGGACRNNHALIRLVKTHHWRSAGRIA
jgi:hypothetical protein